MEVKLEKLYLEKAEDLSFDKNICPISEKVKNILIQYTDTNVILDNGQMIYLNFPQEVKEQIIDYCLNILIEFITSEKSLKKCEEIKDAYISNIDNINNTASYVQSLFDIILAMDRAYKYIWGISKVLIDKNISSHENYILWQKQTTNISEEVREQWQFIYDIRNEIEHPFNRKITQFMRTENNCMTPQIIFKGNNYDLLEIAKTSLVCIHYFFKSIMCSSFFYSKYLVAYTDETRTIIYTAINK